MPSAIPTNLTTAFTELRDQLSALELRTISPLVFKQFLASGKEATGEIVNLRVREDRAVSSAYHVRFAPALVTQRGHNHSGTTNDTNVVAYTWSTYGANYKYTVKQFGNNMLAESDLIIKGVNGCKNTIANGLEQACIDYIQANRQAVVAPALVLPNATYNAGNVSYHITEGFANPIDNGYTFMISVLEGLKNNDRGVEYDIFVDTPTWLRIAQLGSQSNGNAVNASIQFNMDGYSVNIIKTPRLDVVRLALTTVPKAYFVVAPRGQYGANTWIPKECVAGLPTTVNKYGVLPLDSVGVNLGTHEYETRVDGTAGGANGQTQDVSREMQISIDATLFKAPSSVANESPFIAFGLI